MVIPVGDRISQQLLLVRKQDGRIEESIVENVRFVSLIGSHGWKSS